MFRVCVLTSVIRLTTSKLNGAWSWITQITKSNLKVCLGLYPIKGDAYLDLSIWVKIVGGFWEAFLSLLLSWGLISCHTIFKKKQHSNFVPWLLEMKRNEKLSFPMNLQFSVGLFANIQLSHIFLLAIFFNVFFSLQTDFKLMSFLRWALEYWSLNLLICGWRQSLLSF